MRQQHESARSGSHLVPHDGIDDEEWRAAVGGDFTRPVIVGHDLQRIEMVLPSRGTEQRLGHDERGDCEDEVGEGRAESVGGQPGSEPVSDK